ncbi:MAG: hypothetical protein JXR71_12080 [Bacteroidales bacterium]|nr:hypothetical protein [Bacteroidales bacterium]
MKQETYTQTDNSTLTHPEKPSFVVKWNELERFVEETFTQPAENAIDTLLRISKKLKRHKALHYAGFDDKEELKTIYDEDLPRRVQFVSEKIAQNFLQGQQENVYRKDISREMVARNYAKRMMDLHNPKIFPPKKVSFQTIYTMLFDDFIKSISNQNGLRYYEQVVQY